MRSEESMSPKEKNLQSNHNQYFVVVKKRQFRLPVNKKQSMKIQIIGDDRTKFHFIKAPVNLRAD